MGGKRLTRPEALRATLFTIGIRFLPQFQDLKRSTLNQIVLRNAYTLARHDFRPAKCLAKVKARNYSFTIRFADLREALELLEESGYVEVEGNKRKFRGLRVRISSKGIRSVQKDDKEAEKLIDRVCKDLFADLETQDFQYREAFLLVLTELFSLLGREYVSVLLGKKRLDDAITPALTTKICQRIAKRFRDIDPDRLLTKTSDFFASKNPDYAKLAWQMAQGFFALKALGAGKDVWDFAKDFLSGKTLFLDTNVLFHTVLPQMPRYEAVQILARACQEAKAVLAITRPTLEEFSRSLNKQIEDARAILSTLCEIPREVSEKISDPVYYFLMSARESATEKTLAELLGDLPEPNVLVKSSRWIQLIEDPWFEKCRDSKELVLLTEKVAQVYSKLKGRKKTKAVAEHDAMMLLYVAQQHYVGRKALFVTLDTTLPHCQTGLTATDTPLVVTLDALLQWVCPAFHGIVTEAQLAEIFLVSLSERLIPSGTVLTLADFRMLDRLGVQCDRLPEADLIACIERLRKILPTVDPTTPEGRERLLTEIYRFLEAPERHYARELERVREEKRELEEKIKLLEKRHSILLKSLVTLLLVGIGLMIAWFLGKGDGVGKRLASGWSALAAFGLIPWLGKWLLNYWHDR